MCTFRQARTGSVRDTIQSHNKSTAVAAYRRSAMAHVHRRLVISHLFVDKFGAPDKEDWGSGKYSVQGQINRMLDIPSNSRRSTVKVMEDVLECMKRGMPYTGERDTRNMGRKPILSPNGPEANIIANKVEDGLGLNHAWRAVVAYRNDMDLAPVTKAAVIGCYHRMPKVIKAAQRRGQGDYSNDSSWAKARYRWIKQLLIRLGKIVYDGYEDYEEGREPISDPEEVPDYCKHLHMHVLLYVHICTHTSICTHIYVCMCYVCTYMCV